LWELVHVFFDHRGLLEGWQARGVQDPGESRFLYPFLGEQETDLAAVLDDVRSSVIMKSEEVAELRRQTLVEETGALAVAAGAGQRLSSASRASRNRPGGRLNARSG